MPFMQFVYFVAYVLDQSKSSAFLNTCVYKKEEREQKSTFLMFSHGLAFDLVMVYSSGKHLI